MDRRASTDIGFFILEVLVNGAPYAFPEDVGTYGAYFFYVGAVGALVYIPWRLRVFKLLAMRTKSVTREARSPPPGPDYQPPYDTKIREAAHFIMARRWDDATESDDLDDEEAAEKYLVGYSNALAKLRSAALNGELTIWGKNRALGEYLRLEPEYWANHQIEISAAIMGEEDDVLAECLGNHFCTPRARAFRVNKSAVENLWKPKLQQIGSARF